MITNLHLKDFKIHSNLELPLGPLTIITGVNGMGKSSVLQSLLLLRQSYAQRYISGINLKGNIVDLGSAGDIECQSSKDGILSTKLSFNNEVALEFSFSYQKVEPYDTFIPIIGDIIQTPDIEKYALFNNNFQYISAYRFGPQKSYERDTNIVEHQKQISKINGQCEYVVHFLSYYGRKIHCIPDLLYDNKSDDSLETQVQMWIQSISPRIGIKIEYAGQDFKLKYKFSRDENTMTEDMYAINVGYGVTYVLPIIVAILSAEPGALILIENPEAHIHPHAQSELMKLVMRAAKAGIQIIIETHSDHIMNGALVAIAQNEDNLDLVKAYYFERDEHTHTSVPRRLEILKDGRIAEPPKGFFDQIDIDMRLIMGF